MKSGVLILIVSSVFAQIDEKPPSPALHPRLKRGAVGALHIVTNHAQPIHADVKSENSPDNAEKANKKPCRKGSGPAHIEPGVGFQVTPPEDGVTVYEIKSLRKSLPFAPPTTLQLIRSISRVITLIVLFVSGILEFYPTFHRLICTIFSFMNAK